MGEYDDLLAAAARLPARRKSKAKGEDYSDLLAAAGPVDAQLPDPRKFAKLGAPPVQPKEEEPSFLDRAVETVRHGVADVAQVGGDVIQSRGKALLDPQKRRQLERGVGDVVTLGYGNKLAARVGNLFGDVGRGTSINETLHFEGDSAGHRMTGAADAPVSRVESEDAAAAPEYRTVGNVLGSALPGPASIIGKGAGKFVAKVIPQAAGGTVKQILAGAARGTAGYLAAAPVTAALSANAEGDRLGAAYDAATDPAGLLLSASAGGAMGGLGSHAANSKGGQARKYIEERGGTVSAKTPGSGKIFDTMDVGGTTDADIGEQARLSGERVEPKLKQYRKDVANAPYLAEVAKVTPAQAGQLVDARPIYSDMVDSYYRLGSDPQVAAQLKHELDILDQRFTRANGDILVPQDQLNGLRRTLGDLGGVGKDADPSLAPLRSAYNKAKAIVDKGPYVAANAAFAAGAADAEESLKHVGLKHSYSAAAPERDINKLRIKAQRGGQNSVTAGADKPGLDRFEAKHPELALELERPAILRAKGDLSFRLSQDHGGLIDRHTSAVGLAGTVAAAAAGHGHYSAIPVLTALAYQNRDPINGRLLYPLNQPEAAPKVGARIGAASAASRRKERASAR